MSRDLQIAEQPYMHSKAAIPLDRQAKSNLPSTANGSSLLPLPTSLPQTSPDTQQSELPDNSSIV